MSDTAKTNETTFCPLCVKDHQPILLHGMVFVPCPEMPKNLIMPMSSLEAFMAGKSMLDQPLIVIT